MKEFIYRLVLRIKIFFLRQYLREREIEKIIDGDLSSEDTIEVAKEIANLITEEDVANILRENEETISKGKFKLEEVKKQIAVQEAVKPIVTDMKEEAKKYMQKFLTIWFALFGIYYAINMYFYVCERDVLLFALCIGGLSIFQYLLLRFRIRNGYYGNNPNEAMEIVKFIRKKRKNDDSYGNHRKYPIFEKEVAKKSDELINDLLGETA